jgi:hypothetical protein
MTMMSVVVLTALPAGELLHGPFDRAFHVFDRALGPAFELVSLTLPLEPLVAGQIPDGLLDPAFAFVDDFAHFWPPLPRLKKSVELDGAPRPRRCGEAGFGFTIASVLFDAVSMPISYPERE